MRLPLCIFENNDLAYIRNQLGVLRRRGDCLVLNTGDWRRLCKIVESSKGYTTDKMLLLRMCSTFWEMYVKGADKSSLISIAGNVTRLDEQAALWMFDKLSRHKDKKGGYIR